MDEWKMAERKLITPQFRLHIADRILKNGIKAECYSSVDERCSWATVECASSYKDFLDFPSMTPARVELGYDNDFDTLLSGYVTEGKGLGPYKILDHTVFLLRAYVTETFLDCRPQDIIRYGLRKAGIETYVLSDSIYPKKAILSVSRMNIVQLIQEVGRAWGISATFYFKNGSFYWGTGEEQQYVYVLEEGRNILSCLKFTSQYEIKTIGVPWIHQGERIRVKHSKVEGEVTVTAARVKADEEGCVRMYLTFETGVRHG